MVKLIDFRNLRQVTVTVSSRYFFLCTEVYDGTCIAKSDILTPYIRIRYSYHKVRYSYSSGIWTFLDKFTFVMNPRSVFDSDLPMFLCVSLEGKINFLLPFNRFPLFQILPFFLIVEID